MGKEILTFGNIEIEKNKFYYHKNPAPLTDLNTEKVLVSNKIFYLVKKSINTLLVTCIMMIKLSHYL